jgi:hypothetical protein
MPKEVARQREVPMETTVTLSLELTVSEGVEPDANELTETVPDALMEYDGKKRLFPGQFRRDGEPCLQGTAISVEKVERRVDRVAEIIRTSGSRPMSPFYDATDAACPRAVDVSCAVDNKIEELRKAQARIWEARDAAINAKDKAAFDRAIRKMRAGQNTCLKLLNCDLKNIAVPP